MRELPVFFKCLVLNKMLLGRTKQEQIVEQILPDVEGMLSGDWPLSLYTCTFGGQSRLTVRCDYA